MLKIPLKTSFVMQHKSLARPVNIEFRSRYEREAHRYEECLFLTQLGNNMIYTTCTGGAAIQSWETVNFKLPCPLAINLASVPYKLSGDYAELEIPTCTMANVVAFCDKSRPKYIKESDLQTKVVAIDGGRAGLEMINPERFLNMFDNIVRDVRAYRIYNPVQYQWFVRDANNKIDHSIISKIYKIVMGRDVFEYEYLRYPGDKTIFGRIEELQRATDLYGLLKKSRNIDGDEQVFNLPVAVFKKAQQTVIWPGMMERVK